MVLDTAFLSRIQFAFTISFHILFPAFSIGLALFLAIMEGIWIKTKNPHYLHICKFWTKVFALTFGMGVVSGVVMEFQLGTNWAGYTKAVGNVLGSLFTYEVMTAFFIEAGFLGVMLFGWDRVGHKLHCLSTLLVVIGTSLSAYWIMLANTWMQHPVGFIQEGSLFKVANWSPILFQPTAFPRFIHMLLASYISAAFVIISVSALYLSRKIFLDFAKTCFSFTWIALLILLPIQVFIGDKVGVDVFKNQPIKTAAIEAAWETEAGAPLILFAIPDQKNQINRFSISIPHFASVFNTHEWNGVLTGLKTVSIADQPSVIPVFFSFRIMVGMGLLMLLLTLIALWLRYQKRLYDTDWFLKISILSAPLGFIALWCGWVTAEMGRQPWIVYGVLKTTDALSPVALHDVIISFVLIFIVYGIIFGCFYFYFLHKTLHKGPIGITKAEERQPFQYMPSLKERK